MMRRIIFVITSISLSGKMSNIYEEITFGGFELTPIEIRVAWKAAVNRIIDSDVFIGGSEVTAFEKEWSIFSGINESVGVGNGFDGLAISLMAAGVSKGDFVAVPAHTFIATWLAVDSIGAIPVGIDVTADGLLDLDLLFESKQPLKAVIPVHMHGKMVDMVKLCKWAAARSIKVIEDSSQAHGVELNGVRTGQISNAAVFSLYPTKNLGALGDAGVISSNSLEFIESCRGIGNYGSSKVNKYKHETIGRNSRLDPIQAAVLKVNLNYLTTWNNRRREIAEQYFKICEEFKLKPLQEMNAGSVFHHFVVKTPNRDTLREHLKLYGIGSDIHYPNVAGMEYAQIKNLKSKAYPVAESLSKQILSLPIHPWLQEHHILRIQAVLENAHSLSII